MKLSIPGVYAAPRRLANGRVKTYYYHRATGVRLPDDPAAADFLAQVALLNRLVEQDSVGARAAAKAAPARLTTPEAMAASPVAALVAAPTASPVMPPVAVAPKPSQPPEPAERSVKPQLPDGCFKLLFQRFKASTEFTDLAENTKREYARHMQHVEPVLGFHPVAAFTADFMDRLIGKFKETPTLQKAIRRTLSVLLGYAMRILKWIPANPLLGVQKVRRRGRQEVGDRLPLSEPAIARFRKANPYGSRARLIFELGLTTAFRREDLARVPAEDIEAGEIPFRTGKAGTLVVATVTEHLVRALRAFRACHPEHATAFYALGAQKNGQPIHKRTISAEFEVAAKLARFTRHERLHALRYTAATRLFELGLHYDDIARVTGHAMAAMARHYCKLRKDARKRGEMLAAFGDAPYRPGTPLDGAPADCAEAREAAGGRAETYPSKADIRRDSAAPGSCPPDSAGATSRRCPSARRAPVVVTVAGKGKPSPRSQRAPKPAPNRSAQGRRNIFLVTAHAREDPP